MKVVFIITGLSTGGAETMLFKLLQNMNRRRFDPEVISLRERGEMGPRIEALGIPVHALSMKPGSPSLFKFLALTKLLRRLKPDVVHTWMYHADLLGGLASRLNGIRSVVWGIHHCDLSADKNKKSTLLVVRLCALLSRWVPRSIRSCSEKAATIHSDAGYCANKIEVLVNGFDLSRFMPDSMARTSVRAELGLATDNLLFGLIARDHPQKNVSGFIEAAGMVARVLPDVHILLAGTGIDADNARLLALIEATGIPRQFHLLGHRDDIPRLMASLDVLVSSSWGEAFPNVLGEAMACGVPCVVTNVGDSADIVGDTGLVVPPGDMVGLAHHIIELLEQPTLCADLGQRARQRIKDHYEIRAIARQFERFYLDLLRGA